MRPAATVVNSEAYRAYDRASGRKDSRQSCKLRHFPVKWGLSRSLNPESWNLLLYHTIPHSLLPPTWLSKLRQRSLQQEGSFQTRAHSQESPDIWGKCLVWNIENKQCWEIILYESLTFLDVSQVQALCFCSRLSFQRCINGKMPWKIEIMFPSQQRARLFSVQYTPKQKSERLPMCYKRLGLPKLGVTLP